eukprot:5365364-Amphidinium_carterae.3
MSARAAEVNKRGSSSAQASEVAPKRQRTTGDDRRAGRGGREQQRADGRYFRGPGGGEICYTWGRSANGCTSPCPQAREHVCEFCRKTHRTVECPDHQGWQPPKESGPPPSKGKGRNRK